LRGHIPLIIYPPASFFLWSRLPFLKQSANVYRQAGDTQDMLFWVFWWHLWSRW